MLNIKNLFGCNSIINNFIFVLRLVSTLDEKSVGGFQLTFFRCEVQVSDPDPHPDPDPYPDPYPDPDPDPNPYP